MNNQTRATILIIVFVVLGTIAIELLSDLIDGDIVEQVKSGQVELRCDTGNGLQVVDPEKVTGLIDGLWLFTSGSASECGVIKDAR